MNVEIVGLGKVRVGACEHSSPVPERDGKGPQEHVAVIVTVVLVLEVHVRTKNTA